jgi:hypothetical protein
VNYDVLREEAIEKANTDVNGPPKLKLGNIVGIPAVESLSATVLAASLSIITIHDL